MGIYYHDKYIKYGTCLEPVCSTNIPFLQSIFSDCNPEVFVAAFRANAIHIHVHTYTNEKFE
jgi:hypothetical protein